VESTSFQEQQPSCNSLRFYHLYFAVYFYFLVVLLDFPSHAHESPNLLRMKFYFNEFEFIWWSWLNLMNLKFLSTWILYIFVCHENFCTFFLSICKSDVVVRKPKWWHTWTHITVRKLWQWGICCCIAIRKLYWWCTCSHAMIKKLPQWCIYSRVQIPLQLKVLARA